MWKERSRATPWKCPGDENQGSRVVGIQHAGSGRGASGIFKDEQHPQADSDSRRCGLVRAGDRDSPEAFSGRDGGGAGKDDYVSPIAEEAQLGYVGSRPPGPMGGNMDLNELGEGATLYLPVFQKGAQFFTGDPHQVQGNVDLSATAL